MQFCFTGYILRIPWVSRNHGKSLGQVKCPPIGVLRPRRVPAYSIWIKLYIYPVVKQPSPFLFCFTRGWNSRIKNILCDDPSLVDTSLYFSLLRVVRPYLKIQNSWTMDIKQDVMSHTRITHDEFRRYKIQNNFNYF